MSCSIDEDSSEYDFDLPPLPIELQGEIWKGREVQKVNTSPSFAIPQLPNTETLSSFFQRNFSDLTFGDLDEEEEMEFPEEEWAIAEAMAFIEKNCRDDLTVEEILALRGLMFDHEQGKNTICKSLVRRFGHVIKKVGHEIKKGVKKAAKKAKEAAKKAITMVKNPHKGLIHFVKDTKGAAEIVKDTVKVVGKGMNDLSEGLCHAAKEVHQWFKEHPKVTKAVKIVAITAAVVAAAVLLYPVIAAAAVAASQAVAWAITLAMTAAAEVVDKMVNKSPRSKEEDEGIEADGLDLQNDPDDSPFKTPFKTYLEDRQLSAIDSDYVPRNNPYIPIPDAPVPNHPKTLPERRASSQRNEASETASIPPIPQPQNAAPSLWTEVLHKMRQGLETIGRGLSEPELPTSSPLPAKEAPEASAHVEASSKTENKGIDPIPASSTLASVEPKSVFSSFLETLRHGLQTIGEGMTETELRDSETPLDIFHKAYADLQKPPGSNDQSKDGKASAENKNRITTLYESLVKQGKTFARDILESGSINATSSSDESDKSRIYKTEGQEREGLQLTFDNGIFNTFEYAKGNAEHIRSLCPEDICIFGIYNQTHGPIIDGAEVVFLNFVGYSPHTANLLRSTWTEFHEKNLHRPNAKILHFCHSKGGLDTINALEGLPEEIRKRLIVVSIASADHVPKELCFNSFNYASEKDIVPFFQVLIHSLYASPLNEKEQASRLKKVWDNYNNTIFLKADEDSSFFDHEFQSKTYVSTIQDHIDEYLSKNGEYK